MFPRKISSSFHSTDQEALFITGRISKLFKVTLLLVATITLFSFYTILENDKKVTESVLSYYKANLDSLNKSIELFDKEAPTATQNRLKILFTNARSHYKRIEFLIEYHYPATAIKLNGPALLESEPSEPNEPQHPSGFQVLEPIVFGELSEDSRKQIAFELSNIKNRIERLYTLLPGLELTESNLIDAVRLNVYRLITKGITGFDSPIALNSLEETISTLQSTKQVLLYFGAKEATPTVDSALKYITNSQGGFDAFNRATFIREYINPLCEQLYDFQVKENIAFAKQHTALKQTAKTLFEKDAFDPLFYAPSGTVKATVAQIELGRKLFNEPILSANGKRSCNSCHLPEKAFTDGLELNEALTGNKKLLRNTPTLLNAALQPALFYDSHIAFLEDQAHDVISNRQEMGGLFEHITKKLQKNKDYNSRFAQAYPSTNVSPANIKSALAAYVRSLIKMNSPFDKYMRGEEKAMSNEALKGFNLFMGKAKCGTCHFMPLFNGTVPPLYDKIESEVLGVPANADTIHPAQDLDSGKYHLYNIPHQLFAFKTSTVRNIALTAPYMHNGVFKTLEEVIDFYNKGGGAGLGFDLPNQTLPTDKLNLNDKEKQQIIAFLHSLTDN